MSFEVNQKKRNMKSMKTTLLIVVLALATTKSWAFYVYTPPDNIVQNGSFHSYSANWSGNAGYLGRWASVPNDYAALPGDLYQDLSTIPGQQYAISFYAAADLYYGPSASIAVDLNQQTLISFATPPYTYNNQINRYDQMHWQQVNSSFVASASTTRLEFIDMNTYDFGLAAVSVVPVPEPTSTILILMTVLIMVCCPRWRRQAQPNKSLHATRDGRFSSASRFTSFGPACLSSGR